MAGAGWALLCRPWVCLLEWNIVRFSVQGGVNLETSKACAEREVSQQQLHSSICGFATLVFSGQG